MAGELIQPGPDCVVTGLGTWSAAGSSPERLWHAAQAGRSPARWLRAGQGGGPYPACLAPDPVFATPLAILAHKSDRSVQLALAAALQAQQQAGLAELAPDRIGIVAGTSRGPVAKWHEAFRQCAENRRLRPTLSAHTAIASLSGAVSLAIGSQGPAFTVAATCASGAHAIATAAQLIAAGEADAVLAGGAEAPLEPAVLESFASAGLLATHRDPARACRPFDQERNGLVLGEGAAFVVLESAASARRRGVPVLARLTGWALGAEGASRSAPEAGGAGLARTMASALARAGLAPGQIDYVNAHGTGTLMNDEVEARAMLRVFGEKLPLIPCSSTKPATGHCLGASAAIEAVICLQALAAQCIPPTPNCDHLDGACLRLDIVRHTARPALLRHVMSNSQGFWGNQASLIFSRTV